MNNDKLLSMEAIKMKRFMSQFKVIHDEQHLKATGSSGVIEELSVEERNLAINLSLITNA